MLPINLRLNLVCGVVIKGQETLTLIAVSSLKINQHMSFCHERFRRKQLTEPVARAS